MTQRIAKWGWITFFTMLLILVQAHEVRAAESMDIQLDELAQESVLPKFDRPDSVRHRNVITEKRFELGAYYGWNILEPILNQSKVGVNLGYHLTEQSAVMFNYAQWMSGLNSQYTDGLAGGGNNLDFTRSPKLKYSLFAHYEWKIYYGKISFTKQGVVNLSTYPIFGAGMTAYEHKSYFGADVGIGQKFYFGKSVALRADFKLQYSQKPSPFLKGYMKNTDPVPQPGLFNEKWDLGTMLDFGVTFLL
ncbi:MAG: outer membrane beta-barrel domain-containing protein [Pseudobdellovibrionaceae bacterium]